MSKLAILIAPDRRLKTRAEPVEKVDGEVARLLDDMLETMYAAPGVGLAGPQVGVSRRVVVLDCAREGEEPNPLKLVNPEILWRSEETVESHEGCLSLPEVFVDVPRAAEIRVGYRDEAGEAREIEAGDLLSRCIQHEIDHLDGRLHVDYLSAVKRNLILRRLEKAKRRGEL